MPKRMWPAFVIAAISVLLVGDAHALKKGGIFLVGTPGASVQVDPQIAYVTTAWWLEYATAAKLVNYPDKNGQAGALLRPEVASRYGVSRNGKVYTFTIRKGFRFSDGASVTARNFKYAFQRIARKPLDSPAADFTTNVRAVTARGNKLTIRLKQPDGGLLSMLAMPFFQATSLKLPLDREVTNGYPSAGPYYYSRNDVNELTSIRQNRFWRRGPGRHRPRNLAGVDIRWNENEQTAFQQVLANDLDLGPIPAAEVQQIAQRFGVNKSRFWTKPINCIGSIPFNNESGLFAGNPALRRAINWALDRRAYIQGPYSGSPWTHILSPLTPGSITAKRRQPYTPGPDIARARKLAAGHFRSGKIVVAYRLSGTIAPAQAQIVRRDLIRLGFEDSKIQMRSFAGAQIYTAMSVRGNDIDMGVSMGWCGSSLDGSADLKAALGSAGLHDASYDRKLARAANLRGSARLRALGKLDLEIMTKLAPFAPMMVYNNHFLFSNRVDPRSLVYQSVYTDWSIPALALK